MLGQFSLERLTGFDWAQRQARMEQVQACAASNATTCTLDQVRCSGLEASFAFSFVSPLGAQVIKFQWPQEISDTMREIFAVMNIV